MIRNAGDPASSFTQEAQFGIACGLVVVSATIALLPTKSINVICKFCLYIVVFGCALIIVVIPAIAPTHQPSSFVFGHWQNGDASGIGSQIKTSTGRDAYTVCNGLLMARVACVPSNRMRIGSHAALFRPNTL